MMHIRARDRMEVDGRTLIFVPKSSLSHEDLLHILAGEKLTFSARNENNGIHQRKLERNIMIPLEVRETPSGYNIFLKLDHESLPVSRRELDGA